MESLPSRAMSFLNDENIDLRERNIFRDFIKTHSKLINTIANEFHQLDKSKHFYEFIHNTNKHIIANHNALTYKYNFVFDRYFESLIRHFQNRHTSSASEMITKTFYFYLTGLISQGAVINILLMRSINIELPKDTVNIFRAYQMLWLHYLKNPNIHNRILRAYFNKRTTSDQLLSDWIDLFFLSAIWATDVVAATFGTSKQFEYRTANERYRYAREVFDKTGIIDLILYEYADTGIPLTIDSWLEVIHSMNTVGFLMHTRKVQKLIVSPIRNRIALRKFYENLVNQFMHDAVANKNISDERRFARLSALFTINVYLWKFDNVLNTKVFKTIFKKYNFENKIELFLPILKKFAETLPNPIHINNAIHVFLNSIYQYQRGEYIQNFRPAAKGVIYFQGYLKHHMRAKHNANTLSAKLVVSPDLEKIIEMYDIVIKRGSADKEFIKYNLDLLKRLRKLRYVLYVRDQFIRMQFEFLQMLLDDAVDDAYTQYIKLLKEW